VLVQRPTVRADPLDIAAEPGPQAVARCIHMFDLYHGPRVPLNSVCRVSLSVLLLARNQGERLSVVQLHFLAARGCSRNHACGLRGVESLHAFVSEIDYYSGSDAGRSSVLCFKAKSIPARDLIIPKTKIEFSVRHPSVGFYAVGFLEAVDLLDVVIFHCVLAMVSQPFARRANVVGC